MFDFTRVQAVFLDADDTAFQLRDSIGRLYAAAAEEIGVPLEASDIDEIVLPVWKNFQAMYLNSDAEFETSTEREENFWRGFILAILTEIGAADLYEELVDPIYSFFARADSRNITVGVKEFLERARELDFMTGIFSNNDDRLFPLLEELALSDCFDHVFTSGRIGFKKPSQKSYRFIAASIGVPPQEIVYIGDSKELDYEAARAAGWHSVLLTQEEEPEVLSADSFHTLIRWLEKSTG